MSSIKLNHKLSSVKKIGKYVVETNIEYAKYHDFADMNEINLSFSELIITDGKKVIVGLLYENGKYSMAPIVLAKVYKKKILIHLEELENNNVTIVEDGMLAFFLYYDTETYQEIPPTLYEGVANALACVDKYRNRKKETNEDINKIKEAIVG